jgi:3-oxoacyl-[acyl-carrier-protein] synthase II
MNLKRVVVTGLGAVTPIGNTVPEFWNNAIAGMSGAAPITNFDTDAIKTKIKFACEVKGFDLDRYIDRKEARKMDRYTHYSVASAVQAIEDSGLDMEKEDLERIGVIIGFGMGGVGSFVEGIETITEQAKRGQELKVTPFFVPRILGSIAAGQISIMYNLKGPNYTTSSACASGTHAIIDAVNMLRLAGPMLL